MLQGQPGELSELESKEQKKTGLDRDLPFITRWELFLADQNHATIYRYFELPKDKSFLKKYIFAEQNKAEIINAIPTGKTSWRRFKAGCLEMLSAKP